MAEQTGCILTVNGVRIRVPGTEVRLSCDAQTPIVIIGDVREVTASGPVTVVGNVEKASGTGVCVLGGVDTVSAGTVASVLGDVRTVSAGTGAGVLGNVIGNVHAGTGVVLCKEVVPAADMNGIRKGATGGDHDRRPRR